MTAFEYLKSLPRPYGDISGKGEASNGQLKRWLKNGSVLINGKYPKPEDEVSFVWQFVFFPDSNRRTTIFEEIHIA